MADQTQRLEIATVRAEVGSNIVFRFANDAAGGESIPTESGNIQNLKQVVLDIQQEAADKISISTTIYATVTKGLQATADQGIFLVQSNGADEIYSVWQNQGGTAVNTGKTALSATAIQTALDASNEAAQAAENAADLAIERTARYLAPSSTQPTVRDNGLPLQIGDVWFNTVEQTEYRYTEQGWRANESIQAIADLESKIVEIPAPESIPRSGADGRISADWLPDIYRNTAALTLEQCGISSSNTPGQNAEKLKEAIISGKPISGSRKAYSFKFGRDAISYSGSVLQLDLGPHLHKFVDWGGIVANNLSVLEYNGRIDADGGYCKGLGRFRRLIRVKIGIMEFSNAFLDNPTSEQQFFGLEYSSDTYGDNPLVLTADSIIVKNVLTKTYERSTGNAIPMTVIGNYGTGATHVKNHLLSIGNMHIEDYYSVAQDGVTPIDGDSDVCRMFTNPTQIAIGNIFAKNIAKRFFKTQEETNVFVGTCTWESDARFTQAVFIGFFEAQVANSGRSTHFEVGTCTANQASGTQRPLLFNASGLPHSIHIGELKYKNVGLYSADQDVSIDILKANGQGLSVTAPASNQLSIRKFRDSAISNINVSRGWLEKFRLSFDPATPPGTQFFLAGLHLKDGSLEGWSSTNRAAQVYAIDNVTLNMTTGSTAVRPFRPVAGQLVKAASLRVTDATGTISGIWESPGGTGTLILENLRAAGGAGISAGAFTTGTWEVRLNDCVPSTFTGSGATVRTASYT